MIKDKTDLLEEINFNDNEKNKGLGFFEKYLTLWVAICIVVGVLIGVYLPQIPQTLDKFTYAQVSIPVAILIWLMIYPMMLKIDFSAIKDATKQKKGLIITCTTNWLIKPFTMYAIAYFFLIIVFKNIIPSDLAKEYLAGAVLLGAATLFTFFRSGIVLWDFALLALSTRMAIPMLFVMIMCWMVSRIFCCNPHIIMLY